MDTGTIVKPQGAGNGLPGPGNEVIIGVVTEHRPAHPGYVYVVWLSDLRGIFACQEWKGDLVEASLSERQSIAEANRVGEGDPLLSHVEVAQVIGRLDRWISPEDFSPSPELVQSSDNGVTDRFTD